MYSTKAQSDINLKPKRKRRRSIAKAIEMQPKSILMEAVMQQEEEVIDFNSRSRRREQEDSFGDDVEEKPKETTPEEESVYTVNGQSFTESQIKHIIWLTEKDTKFNPLRMLTFFLFHMLFWIFSPIIAIPVIIAINNFRTNLVRSMGFFGCNPVFIFQSLFTSLSSLSLFFAYRTYLESQEPDSEVEFNPYDYIHFILIVLTRNIMIGVKYGFYSDEHVDLLYNQALSNDLIGFDIIINVVNNNLPTSLRQRI